MPGSSFVPVKNTQSRVFVIEGRARGDHRPDYESSLRMTGVSQDFGDITRIESPDPYNYGKFEEIGSTRGETGRPTAGLEGRYAMELKSALMKLATDGCAVDVQLHFGRCTDPSDFNTFEKALVLEQAYLTNFSTEDLGALSSGDEAVVNESSDISAKMMYEVLKMNFGAKAGEIVTNEVIDVTICDAASCGDCDEESDGCNKIFAISLQAGGSPSTPADIIFSLDKGVTWYAHDIDTLGAAEDPNAIACVGSYIFVVSEDSASLHYALKDEFDGVTDPAFTEVATGFVAAGGPLDASVVGNKVFIVGEAGYIYFTEDITSGVTVLDAGTLTTSNLNAVHAYSEELVVAVGDNGVVMYTENGETFSLATFPVAYGVHLNCVWAKNKTEWWVGSSAGRLYYTLDGGGTWAEKSFPGSGTGSVRDIVFATDSVAFLSHSTTTPAGRILRSYNGGYSWVVLPERVGSSMPANDRVDALAVCGDANFVVGVGLADNGTDGFITVGLSV